MDLVVVPDPGLLLDKLVAAVARDIFYRLQLASHLKHFLGKKDLAAALCGLVLD